MCIKKPSFLIFVLPLVILTALSTIIPERPLYAKGAVRSGGSSDRTSNESSDRNSGSNERDSSDNRTSSENRTTDEPKSEPAETTPPPSYNQPSELRSDSDQDRIKGHVNTTPEPVRIGGSESPSVSSEQRELKSVSQKGSYRKDYEDIGKIWQERQERRDNNKTHKDNDTHVNVNVYYPGKYSYYRYDYAPGYSYPSVYCYYYGYCPPYIQGHRVVYVYHNPVIHYSYIDLPSIIISDPWDRDDYYLYQGNHKSLSYALRDVRRSWERSDINLLMEHVRQSSQVDIFLKGEYSYSLNKQDYYDMTRDAMSSVKTASFDFYRVRQRNSSDAVAYGKHVYYDEWDNNNYYYYYKQPSRQITVYVSYTLKRYGNEWYITEVGCSPYKLD